MDLLELWEQMGLAVKTLMLILGLMSMWSMGVFFERLFTFTQAGKQSKAFAPQVAKHLKDSQLKDAIAVSQSKNYKYSHLGKVVLAGLQEYQFQKDAGVELTRDDLIDSVRRAIQRASALTAADLKKGMGSLATIGATAVFVGLLATTLGVINAFQGIAATGSGGLGAVSAGIAEALVGTAVGLFVAIPAVWFYNYLTSRIEFFNVEMDNSSSELGRLLHQESRLGVCRAGAGPPARRAIGSRPARDTGANRGETPMGMQVGDKKGAMNAEINITPLADVMLVLLIIVMLIAPLLQKGVDVTLPEAANTTDKPENDTQTVLAVTADGRFYVDSTQTSEQEMLATVQTVLERKFEKVVLIKADQDAQYADVMAVLDRLQRAGIEDIGLITERKVGSGGISAGGGD